jgi:hypothetical protein
LQHQHLAINGVLPPFAGEMIHWRKVFWLGKKSITGNARESGEPSPLAAVSEAI